MGAHPVLVACAALSCLAFCALTILGAALK